MYLAIGLLGSAKQCTAGFRNLYFVSFLDDTNYLIRWPVYDLDLLLRLTPHLGPALSIQPNESILS